jgi:hypothetical protein
MTWFVRIILSGGDLAFLSSDSALGGAIGSISPKSRAIAIN